MSQVDRVADDSENLAGRFRSLWNIFLLVISYIEAHFMLRNLLVAVSAIALFFVGFGNPTKLLHPLGFSDISLAYMMAVLWANGTPNGSNWIGFPFGIDLRYFPTNDVIQDFFAGFLTHISGNTYLGINLVWAISFPITALAVIWVLRLVGARGTLSWALALVVTFIPFHWARVEHTYLSTMYSAVLGIGIAYLIGSGKFEVAIRRKRGWQLFLFVLGIATITAVVGLSGIYYAVFTALFIVASILWRLLISGGNKLRLLLTSFSILVVLLITTVIPLLPAVMLSMGSETANAITKREPLESVVYAGSLALTLFPAPHLANSLLAPIYWISEQISKAAFTVPIVSESQSSSNYGSISTALVLVFVICAACILVRRLFKADVIIKNGGKRRWRDLGFLSYLSIVAILFFIPWGLNFVFAVLINPSIRAWGRLTPILFLLTALLAVCLWNLFRISWKGISAILAAGALVIVMPYDSAYSWRTSIDSGIVIGREFEVKGSNYAAQLNRAIPGNCGVLQLPFVKFPEEPPMIRMGPYDHLWPALTNQTKNWSYGAIKNTPEGRFVEKFSSSLSPTDVIELKKMGFCAVHVDKLGFSESELSDVISNLQTELGQPVAVGMNGRWIAYRL